MSMLIQGQETGGGVGVTGTIPAADDSAGMSRRLGSTVRRAIEDIYVLAAQDELIIGDRLPSERELAQELMVSRSTIRAALAYLRERGEIITGHGREGTILAKDIAHVSAQERIDVKTKSTRLIERPSGSADGVPSMLASQGLECRTVVLDARVCECPEGIGRAFGFRGSAPLIRIERRRTVLDEPLSYEQTYVNQRIYPHFLDYDLTQSISQLLRVRCGAKVATVQEMIQVVPAFGRCAKLLSLKSGTPVLYAVSRAVGEDGRTVVLSHDMFPANRVRLTTSRSLCPAR